MTETAREITAEQLYRIIDEITDDGHLGKFGLGKVWVDAQIDFERFASKVFDAIKPARTPAASNYRRVTDYLPPEYEAVLTLHEDDLYPVPAFHIGGEWLRETEGSEDEYGAPGKHEPLARTPTHWCPFPPHPAEET